MPSLSAVLLSVFVCALSVGAVFGQSASYSFCYVINGLQASTLDDPYSIAVYVSGTYDPTLQTSTATKYTPAGQYYNLLTGTGTRTTYTRNGLTVEHDIAQLDAIGFDYANNRFYVSNQSFPQFVDGDGLAFNLTEAGQFPGKTISTFWNVYRTGVYGAVLEDKTSGIDLHNSAFSLAADGFPEWTGPSSSDPSTCQPNEFSLPSTPSLSGSQQVHLIYNLTRTSNPKWNVLVDVTFTTNNAVYGPDEFGDSWLQLASVVASAPHTRTYCIAGACSVSQIIGVAPVGTVGFADNSVFAYRPWFDYNGPAYILDTPQPKPGYTNTNSTTLVNPYVTKAGQFFEGFGVGGTGPNGAANAALTTFSVQFI